MINENSDVLWQEWQDLSEDEWKRKVLAEHDDYGKLIAASGYPTNARLRRIMEYLITPLEARVCVQIIWSPHQVKDLADLLNLDEATINTTLDILHMKGLIQPRNIHTLEGFRYRLSTGRLHKSILSNPMLDAEYPRLCEFWDNFVRHEEGEWQCISRLRASDAHQPEQRRILPAWKALVLGSDRDQMQPWEDQREIAGAAELCVELSCACRRQTSGAGNRCKRTTLEACLVFGREAEYALSKGIGRILSNAELLAIMEQASYEGLGGSYINARTTQARDLCYCCDCCCHLWLPMNLHNIPQKYRGWAKSRWEPCINPDLCNGCVDKNNSCADRCLWQAIEITSVNGILRAFIDTDKCWGCGSCALRCPQKAIEMKCVRPVEWVPETLQNLHPYPEWSPPRIVGETLDNYLKKRAPD